MRQVSRFSSFVFRLHLARVRPLVLGLFAASAILSSCGGSGGGAGGGGGLTVALSKPASTVYTHGTVAIEVMVSGGTPDRVELLKDGALLVTLLSPYQNDWDTASTPEGSYQLVARATQGSRSFTSEPSTVVVDRTPPAVASRVPGPNATNVLVDDPILVGFTKPVLPASVGPDCFALRSGSTLVPTTPLLSGDGKTVMLVRHNSLAVPATLTLTVTSSITDLAGNALLGVDAWSWYVPDWVAVGGAINAGSGRELHPFGFALAVDGSGKPVVASSEYDLTYDGVYVRRWTGSAWQAVGGAVNAVRGNYASFPVLALDGSGKAVVAFNEYDGHHTHVYVQRWTGSDWEAVGGALNNDSRHNSLHPALALAVDGKPVVAFYEYDGSHSNVYVQRWTGSTWQPVGGALNAVSGQNARWPVLALDSNGRPIVGFIEVDGQYQNVYVRQWTGSDWQAVGGPVNAVLGHGVDLHAVLALDGNGKPVVAFYESDGSHSNVYVQRWTGSTWQSVGGALNAVSGQDAGQPVLATDDSGRLVVAFPESDGSHYNVYVRRWTGSTWQSVGAALNAVPGQHASSAVLALDGSGNPVVAFHEGDLTGAYSNLYVRHSNQ